MHYLLIDASHLLYRCYWVHQKESEEIISGLAHHITLMSMRKYYREYKPDKIIMAFDRGSWRKEYTAGEACVSKKPYKGDRRQNQTEAEKTKFEAFYKHVQEFEKMLRENTKVVCIAKEKLEADDMIAAFVDMHWDDKITLISGDKDYIQLLDHPNIVLFDPISEKQRKLEEEHGFHLFVKCIRAGEDNIQSAYPGVKTTRLKKAWQDPYEMANLRAHRWKHHDGREFVVGELLDENKLLMDLRATPDKYRAAAIAEIKRSMEEQRSFNWFHFLKYCGTFKLEKVAEQVDLFTEMFSR